MGESLAEIPANNELSPRGATASIKSPALAGLKQRFVKDSASNPSKHANYANDLNDEEGKIET